ncbi:MAG: hypothetical protein HY537_17925 [Deltaproteobacteria bacterium]|nr:hypothetical protein [Deltaproteobacteria bacterium]
MMKLLIEIPMGFISVYWDVFTRIIPLIRENPARAFLIIFVLWAHIVVINGLFFLPVLVGKKFDRLFMVHMNNRMRLYLFLPIVARVMRATNYAVEIVIPGSISSVVPTMKGYPFRTQISSFTYLLCWVHVLWYGYAILVCFYFVGVSLGIWNSLT